MDLGTNEHQQIIRRTARDFLTAVCPGSAVRAMEKTQAGYSQEVWSQIAQLGWLGLSFPEKHGGSGSGLLEHVVLAEEIGRALLPGPMMVSSVLCGQILLRSANEKQKAELLPGMASGKIVLSLALTESNEGLGPGPIETLAVPMDDGFLITGKKDLVHYASSADFLVCVARVEGSPDSLVLGLVDTTNPGLNITPVPSIANYPQAEVVFHESWIPNDCVLGKPWEGDEILTGSTEWASLVHCGEMVGRAEKIMDMVVEYAKERFQFDRPIGSFQAVQHQCADLSVAIDMARLLVYRASCSLMEGDLCTEEIAMARVAASDTSRMAQRVGHGIFAGIAYTVEHDMQLYSARARLSEAVWGDTDAQLQRIAQFMGF